MSNIVVEIVPIVYSVRYISIVVVSFELIIDLASDLEEVCVFVISLIKHI
jgi:hypothetical protein